MPVAAHGFDGIMERALFSLSVSLAEEVPAELGLNSPHFACFLAWDARHSSAESVSALAARLLRAGASYFVCWGPDCARVEYVIDQMVSEPGNSFAVPEGSCIMTTSHDSEPIEEALWFFLMNSWPDDHYFDSTRAALAVSVASHEWGVAISTALEDVRGFVQRGSASGVA
jgi:hypothetical protein